MARIPVKKTPAKNSGIFSHGDGSPQKKDPVKQSAPVKRALKEAYRADRKTP